MSDCCFCGSDVNPARADGLVYEDDEVKCDDCGATLHVCVEDGPADEEGNREHVYFGSASRCRHGKREDEPCDLCEIEDGPGSVGEATS